MHLLAFIILIEVVIVCAAFGHGPGAAFVMRLIKSAMKLLTVLALMTLSAVSALAGNKSHVPWKRARNSRGELGRSHRLLFHPQLTLHRASKPNENTLIIQGRDLWPAGPGRDHLSQSSARQSGRFPG